MTTLTTDDYENFKCKILHSIFVLSLIYIKYIYIFVLSKLSSSRRLWLELILQSKYRVFPGTECSWLTALFFYFIYLYKLLYAHTIILSIHNKMLFAVIPVSLLSVVWWSHVHGHIRLFPFKVTLIGSKTHISTLLAIFKTPFISQFWYSL